tara:strand:+ start:783 stop:980 length:198 start_codon:yes stop_codon:yes gene_type:complete
MILALAFVSAFWFADNAEFVKTTELQREEGFRWHQIKCRDRNPDLPAIVITTATGREIVCHKLYK